MHKNALTITVTSLIMGIFGAFLRWLQNINLYDADTGLPRTWAGISIVLAVFSAAMLAGMILAVRVWLKTPAAPPNPGSILHSESIIPTVVCWSCCVLFAACGVVLMFTAASASLSTFQRLFGASCIVGAACFPFLPTRQAGGSGQKGIAILLTLVFGFWMVFIYRVNAEEPYMWSYVPVVLAVTTDTMAVYYITGLLYDRKILRPALVYLQLAVYLDVVALADSRRLALQGMLVAAAALMLTLEYLLVANTDTRGR